MDETSQGTSPNAIVKFARLCLRGQAAGLSTAAQKRASGRDDTFVGVRSVRDDTVVEVRSVRDDTVVEVRSVRDDTVGVGPKEQKMPQVTQRYS